jgi:penicillin G amidase
MMRELGMSLLSEHIADRLKKENASMYEELDAYARGLNDQVSSRTVLPFEFHLTGLKWEPWEVKDLYLLYKLIDWSSSFGIVEELARSSLLAVNLTVEEVDRLLPSTKEGWAFDSANVIKEHELPEKYKNRNYPSSREFEALPLRDIVGLGMPEFVPSGEGSNAWVISGQHTESGKPMLGGDPHLDNTLPSHWYQLRVNYQ